MVITISIILCLSGIGVAYAGWMDCHTSNPETIKFVSAGDWYGTLYHTADWDCDVAGLYRINTSLSYKSVTSDFMHLNGQSIMVTYLNSGVEFHQLYTEVSSSSGYSADTAYLYRYLRSGTKYSDTLNMLLEWTVAMVADGSREECFTELWSQMVEQVNAIIQR